MADLKSKSLPLFLREEDLRQGIELLFYAYRDFTAEPDAICPHYSRLAPDLSEASGIGRVDGGFRGGFSLRVGD